jgi:deoxyribodipyrimidine photo-lyase
LLTVVSLETLAGINALDIQEIAVMPGETDADRLSLGDALVRARLRWPNAAVIDWVDITSWSDVKASGRVQIVTGFAAVGPTADRLEKLKTESAAQGIALAEHLRDWDRRTWPHYRKGFFHLREKIPSLLNRRGRRV